MGKVKALVRLLLLAAGVGGAILVARRLMGGSSEWESLGDTPSPASTAAPAAPAEPVRTLPEGYDPLTDPIPPDQL